MFPLKWLESKSLKVQEGWTMVQGWNNKRIKGISLKIMIAIIFKTYVYVLMFNF